MGQLVGEGDIGKRDLDVLDHAAPASHRFDCSLMRAQEREGLDQPQALGMIAPGARAVIEERELLGVGTTSNGLPGHFGLEYAFVGTGKCRPVGVIRLKSPQRLRNNVAHIPTPASRRYCLAQSHRANRRAAFRMAANVAFASMSRQAMALVSYRVNQSGADHRDRRRRAARVRQLICHLERERPHPKRGRRQILDHGCSARPRAPGGRQ